MPGPEIRALKMSGTIIPATPAGALDTETLAVALGVSSITALGVYKGQITIANNLTTVVNNVSGLYPNLMILIVDNPIGLLFSDNTGNRITWPVKKLLMMGVGNFASPTAINVYLDGRNAVTTECPEVVQGSVVNYYLALCRASVS